MAYNENLPADTTVPAQIRENFRALKDDEIVTAATSITTTKLAIPRNINGVVFDGSEDITITQLNGIDIATVDQIPTSLPANGGDADTVDGLHASELMASSMPLGGIIMWSGSISSIPMNWHLCDGSNGTPDLRNRFIAGAGADVGIYVPDGVGPNDLAPGYFAVGQTGGEQRHKLSIDEMPAHSHSMNGRFWKYVNGEGGSTCLFPTSPYINTASTGGDQPYNVLPSYYALAYIMKVA